MTFDHLPTGDDQNSPEVPKVSLRPVPDGRDGPRRGPDGRAEEGQVPEVPEEEAEEVVDPHVLDHR